MANTRVGNNCLFKRKIDEVNAFEQSVQQWVLASVREFCQKFPEEVLAEALKQQTPSASSNVDKAVKQFKFESMELQDDDIVEIVNKIDKSDSDPQEKAVVQVNVASLPWRLVCVLKTAFHRASYSDKQVDCNTKPIYTNAGALLVDLEDWESVEAAYVTHLEMQCGEFETPSESEVEEKGIEFEGDDDSVEHDCWVLRAEANETAVLEWLKEDCGAYFSEWKWQSHAIKTDKDQAFVRKPRVCVSP